VLAARRLRAQAAGALAAALTGDLVADRPWLGNLADLRAGAGDVDGALEGLEAATLAFPGDPTFLLAGARIANEAGRFPTALALADRGLAVAWGDNRLRMAIQRARALVGLHRADEAKAFVDATLAAHPAPPDGVDVRTNRYRKQLTDALSVE
jgi:predicted Zn-dependent protease